jgi:hypothetical protein
MLMIRERLLSVWLAYRRLTQLSFPDAFQSRSLAYVILLIVRIAHALHA